MTVHSFFGWPNMPLIWEEFAEFSVPLWRDIHRHYVIEVYIFVWGATALAKNRAPARVMCGARMVPGRSCSIHGESVEALWPNASIVSSNVLLRSKCILTAIMSCTATDVYSGSLPSLWRDDPRRSSHVGKPSTVIKKWPQLQLTLQLYLIQNGCRRLINWLYFCIQRGPIV